MEREDAKPSPPTPPLIKQALQGDVHIHPWVVILQSAYLQREAERPRKTFIHLSPAPAVPV